MRTQTIAKKMIALTNEALTTSSPGQLLKALIDPKIEQADAQKLLAFFADMTASAIVTGLLPASFLKRCLEERDSQFNGGEETDEQSQA